ncbi:hypothetical protein FRC15_010146 [Serendipita sp. 397]|nr:hypothetical protein FRC15_010146 [Serendipita sp. 397]
MSAPNYRVRLQNLLSRAGYREQDHYYWTEQTTVLNGHDYHTATFCFGNVTIPNDTLQKSKALAKEEAARLAFLFVSNYLNPPIRSQ